MLHNIFLFCLFRNFVLSSKIILWIVNKKYNCFHTGESNALLSGLSGLGAAGIIGAAALLALIAFAAWQGKRMKQKLKREEKSRLGAVYDNELYVAADNGGENPLYQPQDLDKAEWWSAMKDQAKKRENDESLFRNY